MNTERWVMPTGRVAAINLNDPQPAVEAARELLAMNGAQLINESAPDAVAPAVRGDDQNTNTHEGEPTMDTIISSTTDKRETLAPIYGPNDPRWHELAEWFTANRAELLADRRITSDEDMMAELWPSERATWLVMHVRGQVAIDAHLEIEFPTFPHDAGTPPTWAGSAPHDNGIEPVSELPSRLWERRLLDEAGVSVDIVREDTWNPDTGEVVEGPERISLWIGDGRVDLPDADATPEGLRRISTALLKAANAAERELS